MLAFGTLSLLDGVFVVCMTRTSDAHALCQFTCPQQCR